jgi:hypothetical protein
MTTNQNMTYEAVEEQQRTFCKELNHQYVPADPDSKVGLALETQGRVPINGLRHPPQGDTNGWYLWDGEEFPSNDGSFSPVHTDHLIKLRPEVLKFLGLPPGYRFLLADDYVDVWFDPSLLHV